MAVLKGPCCDQKINSYFSLDLKTMLTKNEATKGLRLDLKRHLFISSRIFLFNGLPLLTLSSSENWIEEEMTSKVL